MLEAGQSVYWLRLSFVEDEQGVVGEGPHNASSRRPSFGFFKAE